METEGSTFDTDVVDGLHFLEHSVLQVPFFLMSLMRYITPTLDDMFMNSLQWVDQTYLQKHKTEDPRTLRALFYPNLRMYSRGGPTAAGDKKKPMEAIMAFLLRFGRRAGISLAVYALSYLPVVGRFVLPAASFYTFKKAVGLEPALVIFGSSLFLPKRYLVQFLQSYFSSRSLMRELVSKTHCFWIHLVMTRSSLNPTFPASASPRSKRRPGSKTGKVCSSDSASASLFSSRSPCLVSSFTESRKRQPPSSLPKSPTHRHLRPRQKLQILRRVKFLGRTSTSSCLFRWPTSTRST